MSIPLHLNILIEQEDSQFVAHCLELDIVASGQTEDEAFDDLMDLIEAQLEFAVENDNLKNILRPAPPEFWQKLFAMQAEVGHCHYQRTQRPMPGTRLQFGSVEADRFCYAPH